MPVEVSFTIAETRTEQRLPDLPAGGFIRHIHYRGSQNLLVGRQKW